MKTIETEIQIHASAERVWSILVDLEKYLEWNPFVKRAAGKVAVGEKLEVCMSPPKGKDMVFKPRVKNLVEYSEFSWLGHLGLPEIFDGEHIFIITPDSGGCIFAQKENFTGLLVPLLWPSLESSTRAGFLAMNSALKARAENR